MEKVVAKKQETTAKVEYHLDLVYLSLHAVHNKIHLSSIRNCSVKTISYKTQLIVEAFFNNF